MPGSDDKWKGDGVRRSFAQTIQPGAQTTEIDTPAWEPPVDSHRHGSLLVIAGAPADVGTHVLVEDQVVIGREPRGLQLRDGRISRQHCMVRKIELGWETADMGSTNGSKLNGVRLVAPTVLHDGDKIQLGETVIKFTLVDHTEARYLEHMERLAGHDELTGLNAKHRFDSMLAEAFRSARATHSALAMLMMDMDGLKAINDKHGHLMGAHTIGEVGRILARFLRGHGEASRFGGDEFCAFLPGTDDEIATAMAERIRKRVERTPFERNDVMVHASISIGVASLNADMMSPSALVAAADAALYRAKAKGRNCVST